MASKTNSGVVIVEEAVCECGEPIYKDLGGYWHHFIGDMIWCPKYTAKPSVAQGSQPVIEPIESDAQLESEIRAFDERRFHTTILLLRELQQHRKAQQERIGGRG